MNATIEDLVGTIGELTVEGRILRKTVGTLTAENAALKVALEDKTDKAKNGAKETKTKEK